VLRLKTFGGLSLEREGGVPLGGAAAQRRRVCVLAVLAVARERGVTRDKLIGLLWPEVDEARARSALSQALYALKRDSGEADLITGYDRLALNPGVVTCDASELEDALARGDVARAANLYTGAFLDGVYLDGASEFEHWLDNVRLRLGQAAERALEQLAVEAELRKDYGAAADWWRRLTEIDPLKTRAVIGLMEALAGRGDRAEALRQAERYAERVRNDMDGEPSTAVTAYADTLRGEGERQQLVERYVVERELGRGGMSVVYLARDTKHDRRVALKMLHPDMSAAIGRERFEREIRVTASLQHPHILPLHDSGEWGNALYYVMPFVEGESLRARLARERQLAVPDAIAVAAEVAEALDHAHRHGVIHRDVKPENILLAERHAIVADFGIAHVVSEALDPSLAQAGIRLGTPAYMAPEQIAGHELGPTCDIFSLGCVLFEMLAGRPPWIGASPQAVLRRRHAEPAPPLRALRPDVPSWLSDVVSEMLAEEAPRRPASASEVIRLLSAGASAPPSRLPLIGDEMIGREAELRAACALLERPDVRLLTLTGAGGTGKTRLAVQMARELESRMDRAYFIDLSPVRDPAGVVPAIAAAIGARPQGAHDLLEAVASTCSGRRTLLVVDNFEQVAAATPALTRLLAAAPSVKLLVTSRMRLGIRAEHEFFVTPLSVPMSDASPAARRENPAVRLFMRRALDANAALVFDDETVLATARICARLDGLPLAIELAAARCRLMSPRTIATRIEAGFDLVSGGSRDMPERHQTIRQAVAWSFALLAESERRLFARMAVFAGGCTLAAVEAVCADTDAPLGVVDGVSALVDASLLMREMPAHGNEPRLRMLETVRESVIEMLMSEADAGAVTMRHAEWCLRLAESLAPSLTGEAQHEALATLAAEHANLSAALEHVLSGPDAEVALRFGAALWRYWLVRGDLTEGRERLARILALGAPSDARGDALRADVMTGAAHLAQNSGAVDEATASFESVLETRRRLGDRHGVARALADLGWVAWRRCEFPEARRLSAECLALAEELGATRVAALALTNLGAAALFEGSVDEARTAFTRSADLRAQVADRRGVAFANTFLAWALCRGGALDEAHELLESAIKTLRALGDGRLAFFATDVRAEVFLRQGEPERAATILEIDSISSVRRFGDRWSVAHGLAMASWASRALGRVDRATAFAQESLELRRAEGDRYGAAECLSLLAAAARASGDDAGAVAYLQRSRAIRAEIGDAAGIAECDAELSHLAAVA